MRTTSKPLRKFLREFAGLAHDRELAAALRALRGEFDNWERGELSAFDLNDRIHRYHDGPSRQIWRAYTSNELEAVVAGAIAAGILKKEELPLMLLDYLADSIALREHDL